MSYGIFVIRMFTVLGDHVLNHNEWNCCETPDTKNKYDCLIVSNFSPESFIFLKSCAIIRRLHKLVISRFKRKYLAAESPIYRGNTSKMEESPNITWDLQCTYNAYVKFIIDNVTMNGRLKTLQYSEPTNQFEELQFT